MEFTFFWLCIETVLVESPEDLPDMLLVGSLVHRIDKDVIQVDDNTNKDCINKLLECHRSIH